MYSILALFFLSWFPTIHPKWMCKNYLFLKFYMFRERSSDVASFVEEPLYSNFKMYGTLFLVLITLICYYLLKVNDCITVIHSWQFLCSMKEPVILLLSWKPFCFAFVHPTSFCNSDFFLNFSCFTKKALILLLSWSTLYKTISKCIVSWF